jgi:hypothetical protein
VLVANPESKRVALFQEALRGCRLPPAQVISYADLLAGRDTLGRVVHPGSVVRLESPGQNFEVEKALLAAGAEAAGAEGTPRISRGAALKLTFDKGRILYPRQWYLGLCETLRRLDRQLACCPAHTLMSRPADIAVMFDKRRCQELFAGQALPVPRPLGRVGSYEELRRRMKEAGRPRVFIKLAHGSSASGAVAYETNGPREQAHTTVEVVRQGDELRLYNSRRVRRYDRPADISGIIDMLAREGVQVEEWVPKACLAGRAFDLRVVVIAGRAGQVVVRCSRSPMTNLHLKNERGDLSALRARMNPAVWEEARRTCERSAALFPGSLHAGVDLLITPGYRRHVVLEINAFGDLLPGVLWEGMDTYSAEIRALPAIVGASL